MQNNVGLNNNNNNNNNNNQAFSKRLQDNILVNNNQAFSKRLQENILVKKSPVCAGLDPRAEFIPDFIKKGIELHESFLIFNKMLIDKLYDIVPAVKLQMACYEVLGHRGMRVFEETTTYARKKGLIVIADGKRNDIGSTAEEYAKAYLNNPESGPDSLTVNPYLGEDGVLPFIEYCCKNGKGIFVLIKTSNKSSVQLQDLMLPDGRKIYEVVAGLTESWALKFEGCIGAVVGATWPEEARLLRTLMPSVIFLVPGYGAQGATADDVAEGFYADGSGAIVNASRSIICAWKSEMWKNEFKQEEFHEAARAEALRMTCDINSALARKRRLS